MARQSVDLVRRVRAILGPEGGVDLDVTGTPLVAPRTEEGLALVMQAAAGEGWRILPVGSRSWVAGGEGDLMLSTTGLTRVVDVTPGDLVATVEGGVPWSVLRRALADAGVWVAADPPGGDRTLGSVIATATAGPLRNGLGGVREQLLGVTVVTGEGRLIRAGGRVVKNVAGFDLTRLAAGSYGAFGVITSAHVRLRAVPRADRTLLLAAERDRAVLAGLSMLDAGLTPAALELVSPGASGRSQWTLALRLMGSEEAVEAEHRAAGGAAGHPLEVLDVEEARSFWSAVGRGCLDHPVTLRIGALPASLEDTLDLVAHHLDDGWVTATVGAGSVRWSGQAPLEHLRLFRHAAAQREWPVTVERAPQGLRERVGIFGAYRDGVAGIVGNLRHAFDPSGILSVPLQPGA
ncbi:MAG TPA: FAD-binding oxidoreductase [Gemmatimonadales bacterium]|nr:FAD-binding oxidoreductase [Gemmatimonadales bacterium]